MTLNDLEYTPPPASVHPDVTFVEPYRCQGVPSPDSITTCGSVDWTAMDSRKGEVTGAVTFTTVWHFDATVRACDKVAHGSADVPGFAAAPVTELTYTVFS